MLGAFSINLISSSNFESRIRKGFFSNLTLLVSDKLSKWGFKKFFNSILYFSLQIFQVKGLSQEV